MLITITAHELTIEGMAAEWADDETLTPAMVQAAADAEYAWMVLSVGEYLPGWRFGREGLQGPMMMDMADRIMQLQMSATDYVVQRLDEIRAECVAAEPVAA